VAGIGVAGSGGGVASANGGSSGIGGTPVAVVGSDASSVTEPAHCGAAGVVAAVLSVQAGAAGAVAPGLVAAMGGTPSAAELEKRSNRAHRPSSMTKRSSPPTA
jgi:hypothetical protein